MENRASLYEPSLTRVEGFAFDGHRALLHCRADGSPIRGGVVLCQPLGREARNAYRSLWLFAEQMAAAGFAVLRFDHRGTGESLPLGDTANGWETWIKGVEQACDCLRQNLGVGGLVLGGLRLGATMAAIAAPRVRADALMLLAPVLRGRHWLRELEIETTHLAGHTHSRSAETGFDADGIWLERPTLDGLARFDLMKLTKTAPKVFLAPRGDAAGLPQRLETLDADVRLASFEGYEELFKDACLNSPPDALFHDALSWLDKTAKGWPSTPPAYSLPASTLTVPGGTEHAVSFGRGLKGVLCLPEFSAPERKAVLVVNTDADQRAGIGGFAADVSRAFCRRGIATLRFDFAGLGDSAFDQDWRSHVYETSRDADFDAAIVLLQAAGFTNLVVAGVCSGGFHALQVASRDARIAAAYAVNAAVLAWRKGDPLATPRIDEGSNGPWLRDLKRRILSPQQWRRALSGEIDWATVLSNISLRLKRRFFARMDRRMTSALRANMKQLSRRGGRARLITGSLDSSLDELETHFGPDGRWLTRLPGMSIGTIDGLDHGLLFRDSRRLAMADLVSYVEALPVAATQPATDTSARGLSAGAKLQVAAAQ